MVSEDNESPKRDSVNLTQNPTNFSQEEVTAGAAPLRERLKPLRRVESVVEDLARAVLTASGAVPRGEYELVITELSETKAILAEWLDADDAAEADFTSETDARLTIAIKSARKLIFGEGK